VPRPITSRRGFSLTKAVAMYSNLQIASVLGGKVHGDGVLVPAPGRGPDDRSMWIFPNKSHSDCVVEPQRNDDPAACRIYIDEQIEGARQRTEIKHLRNDRLKKFYTERYTAGDKQLAEIRAAMPVHVKFELPPGQTTWFPKEDPAADIWLMESIKRRSSEREPEIISVGDWIDKMLENGDASDTKAGAPADDNDEPDEADAAAPPIPPDRAPPLVPNLADINGHLYALFSPAFANGYPHAGIEIAWGNPTYKDGAVNQARIFSVFDLETAAAFAVKKNAAGNNVYIAPALRAGTHKEGRAKKDAVITAAFGWAEYDGAGDADRVARLCKANMLWPAVSVVTGTVPDRREQLYFGVEGVPTPADLDAMGAGLIKLLGTDCVFNADRVMRLAGTVNWPTPDKISRGYIAELTKLRLVPEASRYSIEHLSGLGTANDDDNPFSRAGADSGNYKAGRTDDDIMELLEATRTAKNWHNSMRDAIASMLGYDWSNLQIKLACAPYCKNGFGDKDLDGFIDEARVKWDKPDPDAERRQEQQQAKQKGPRVSIVATPYAWTDAKNIPLRDWLYGRLLVRQFLSMTIAPGGVGKSSLIVAEALSMVTARDLLGIKPDRQLKVWLWNLEDPQIETTRKIQAACIHYEIKREEIEGSLFVNSGRDQPLVIAKTLRAGVTICQPVVDDLVKQIKELSIDVLVIDPFVSCHEVEENDNNAIDQVAKQWSRVAELGDCAVHLIHHTRKAPAGTEVTTESGRGAKALSDAVRIARALNVMTEKEGKEAGVDNARFYFRAFNDKANLAPPMAHSDWFRLASVALGNGPFGTDGDDMGVIVKWNLPDPTAGVTGNDFEKVAAMIRSGIWRASPQAARWAGHAIAQALGLVISDPKGKAKAASLLKYWLNTRALIEVSATDPDDRKVHPMIRVRDD
jgi:hypothetical protein